jgi:hypothetical protein
MAGEDAPPAATSMLGKDKAITTAHDVESAAHAILSDYTDTLTTTTTLPVELGPWLGRAAAGGAFQLVKCSSCQRLLSAARAGAHLQQCDPHIVSNGARTLQQRRASREAVMAVISGRGTGGGAAARGAAAPHMHSGSRRASDCGINAAQAGGWNGAMVPLPAPRQGAPLPLLPAPATYARALDEPADIVRPSKLSKATYPTTSIPAPFRPLPVQCAAGAPPALVGPLDPPAPEDSAAAARSLDAQVCALLPLPGHMLWLSLTPGSLPFAGQMARYGRVATHRGLPGLHDPTHSYDKAIAQLGQLMPCGQGKERKHGA